MKPRNRKSKGTVFYYPPEIMPFAYCAASLDIVLHENENARHLYDEIIECHKLPGAIEIFNKLENEIPEGGELLKDIVKKAGFDYYKPPERENLGIPYMRGLMKGAFGLASEYVKRFTPWVLKGKNRNRDFRLLIGKIDELIKVGFNNESERAKGKYKVTLGSEWLVWTVMARSLLESYELRLPDLGRVKIMKVGDRTYSMADVVNDETTTRIHRKLSKEYNDAGFLRKGDDTLDNVTWLWYQCRVAYSGPEEYCRKLLLDNGERLDSANVSNEIRDCDEAIGYPRRKRKKEPNGEETISRFSGLRRIANKLKAVFKKNTK